MASMIGNVVRNLFSRPATRLYPLNKREHPAGVRGHLVFENDRCVFCGDCERACPTGAVRLETTWNGGIGNLAVWDEDDEGELSWVRVYDPLRCILCGRCVEVCKYSAIGVQGDPLPPVLEKKLDQGHVDTW